MGCQPGVSCTAGGGALGGQGGDEHAGAEQRDPLAPQPCPGADVGVFDGDGVAVGGHDPRRDFAAHGVFGLTGAAGLGGVIAADALIALREIVVAVGAQRHPVGAGMARPARVADLAGRQPFVGAPLRPFVLARRRAVLVGVGVAPGPIQCASVERGLAWPPAPRRCCWAAVQADLLDDQSTGGSSRNDANDRLDTFGIHTGAPAYWYLGCDATRVVGD